MRYKIILEYDGTNYSGWQKQNDKFTIQETLENALRLLTKENVNVVGSGRTDAGVHALGQVAHFDITKKIEVEKIMSGINFFVRSEYLSRVNSNHSKNTTFQDISITSCEVVDENFHSRFSAKKRVYQYRIINRRQPTALENFRVWQIFKELNLEKMQEVVHLLSGRRDWSCFRGSECQAKSPIKTIDLAKLYRNGEEIIFEIEAKSFLHHMVRNIVGTIVDVGLNKISKKRFEEIIESNDRTKAGPTAPAYGLYFLKVDY